ncbi:MAG TPA: Na+ dependent nucleoside transporter N-terminal domain-containing protein, partial [Kofleriaceae bacterium]|nr:Na+ dependent nucleoside transporter N-terminal domain-containing protein [Kofleriaceae bacterium]
MRAPSRPVLALWLFTLALIGTGVAVAGDAGAPAAESAPAAEPAPAAQAAATGAAAEADADADADAAAAADAEPEAAQPAPAVTPLVGSSLDTPIWDRLRSVLGLLLIGVIAWVFSTNRKAIPWRVVLWGVGLQLAFAVLILKTPAGEAAFAGLNDGVVALLGFTVEGARFIFGDLVMNNVPVGAGEPGMGPVQAVPGMVARTGGFFAFNVLPTIVFFSSLMTLLYHLGVMQLVVRGLAWVMVRAMQVSGAESLVVAASIFMGQTEAPLTI